MMRRAGSLLAPGLAALLLGCDEGSQVNPFPTDPAGETAPVLLQYACERRYTDYVGSEPMGYREVLVRRADGRFAVHLVSVDGPSGPLTAGSQVYDKYQLWARTGFGNFVAHWREPALRSQALFQQNYLSMVVQENVVVADRFADVLEIQPKFPDRPRYMAWIDRESQVMLKVREYLPSGILASEMEVLSIDYDPDLTQEQFADLSFVTQTEITAESLPAQVTFPTWVPGYVPAGFQQQSVRLASMAGQDAVLWSWTDGLIELVLVEHIELGPEGPGVPPEGWPSQVPVNVRMLAYGSTRYAEFAIQGTQVHLFSKLEFGELQTVMSSLAKLVP